MSETATESETATDRPRVRPTYVLDERDLLSGWLDFHRATLLTKCEGLTDEQLKARPLFSSELSLHGLVRHLAETERNWFQRILIPNPDAPRIWHDPESGQTALGILEGAVWQRDLEVWRAECEASRRVAGSLDLGHTGQWRDKQVSLRSVYLHMIQEYARHNGHADFIREMLDGVVGL
jgi:uncharacterized damage-inducible protein DinB